MTFYGDRLSFAPTPNPKAGRPLLQTAIIKPEELYNSLSSPNIVIVITGKSKLR
jgi:hypothetical protein